MIKISKKTFGKLKKTSYLCSKDRIKGIFYSFKNFRSIYKRTNMKNIFIHHHQPQQWQPFAYGIDVYIN